MSINLEPDLLRIVRRIVRAHLRLWGPELDALADRALITVNELLTNVLEHTEPDDNGRRNAKLLVQRVPGGLTVIVRDRDTSQPTHTAPDALDETGRGLLLVAALALSVRHRCR
ncbi:ATP-binding protein [Streptomyces sp. NPDC060064]|uniref:ATP-binding protein n=1 Tax=Streptomyces sp. NPDC060064 TaxID=3347049 RepID=UPI0036BAEEBF